MTPKPIVTILKRNLKIDLSKKSAFWSFDWMDHIDLLRGFIGSIDPYFFPTKDRTQNFNIVCPCPHH